MFPRSKTYLQSHEYYCVRTMKPNYALEDIPALNTAFEKEHGLRPTLLACYVLDGKRIDTPKKPRETVDLIRFCASSYARFGKEKIGMKHITNYDPEKGTFETFDATYQLTPLYDVHVQVRNDLRDRS